MRGALSGSGARAPPHRESRLFLPARHRRSVTAWLIVVDRSDDPRSESACGQRDRADPRDARAMASGPSRQRSMLKSPCTGTSSRTLRSDGVRAGAFGGFRDRPHRCRARCRAGAGQGADRGRRGGWPDSPAIMGSRGSTDLSASMVSMPSPAARISAGLTEADTVAEEMTDGAARIGDRSFVGTVRSSQVRRMPVMAPRRSVTAASRAGHCSERRSASPVIDRRMIAQGRPVERCRDAAGAQIGLGRRAGDRTAGTEQTARGFGDSGWRRTAHGGWLAASVGRAAGKGNTALRRWLRPNCADRGYGRSGRGDRHVPPVGIAPFAGSAGTVIGPCSRT